MNIVGARDQLTEIRDRLWLGAVLDNTPTLEPDKLGYYNGAIDETLSLSLRYRYQAGVYYPEETIGGVADIPGTTIPAYWSSRDVEAVLKVAVWEDPMKEVMVGYLRGDEYMARWKTEKALVYREDPIRSSRNLSDLLVVICGANSLPREL